MYGTYKYVRAQLNKCATFHTLVLQERNNHLLLHEYPNPSYRGVGLYHFTASDKFFCMCEKGYVDTERDLNSSHHFEIWHVSESGSKFISTKIDD